MISLEILTFKNGRADGQVPTFWQLWRCVSGLSREGKKKTGKMEKELTYNSEGWVESQPKSMTGNLVSITGRWAVLSKWEWKLFEKMNSSHALKEEEWRIYPWRTLPAWPGSLPGLGNSPITRGYHQKTQSFHEGRKYKLCLIPDIITISCIKMLILLCFSVQKNLTGYSHFGVGLIGPYLNSIFWRIKPQK